MRASIRPISGETGRRLVGLVAARSDRRDRVVVVAATVERVAERQADEVGAEAVGPRPGEAERRDRHHDQRGCASPKRVEVDARARAAPAAQGCEMKTSAPASRRAELVAAFGRAVVDDDAALVGVVVPEGQAVVGVEPVVGERSDGAARRSLGRLDLDHVGAHLGQQLARASRRRCRRPAPPPSAPSSTRSSPGIQMIPSDVSSSYSSSSMPERCPVNT